MKTKFSFILITMLLLVCLVSCSENKTNGGSSTTVKANTSGTLDAFIYNWNNAPGFVEGENDHFDANNMYNFDFCLYRTEANLKSTSGLDKRKAEVEKKGSALTSYKMYPDKNKELEISIMTDNDGKMITIGVSNIGYKSDKDYGRNRETTEMIDNLNYGLWTKALGSYYGESYPYSKASAQIKKLAGTINSTTGKGSISLEDKTTLEATIYPYGNSSFIIS